MSHHDIDDPARKAAEAQSATVSLSSTPTEITRLPVEDLEDLKEELGKEMGAVDERILAEAEVIKRIVAKTTPRLLEIDEEVFPLVSVVGQYGQSESRRLLEVPGSGRASGLSFEADSFRFTSLVIYITPEGDLPSFPATRIKRGRRVIYNRGLRTIPREIVQNRNGIFEALDSAAYRGVWTPKNHRPKTPKG